jgi:micrococcal nuclease|tara:strand:- start:204 stop:602 length:399 start_codon:yes stop_codon:yes gene_type:complete
MYIYEAKVLRVVDGDTIDALIDIGFSVWVKKRIRFYGINTPESRTRDLIEKKKGLAAKDRLIELLESNENKFKIKSHGVGKYGRCLGELFIPGTEKQLNESYYNSKYEGFEVNINQQLVKEGFATEYFGGSK